MAFELLIRFIAEDGQCHFGEPLISSAEELQAHLAQGILKARLLQGLEGRRYLDFEAASPIHPEKIVAVKQLVGPLNAEHVPIVRCIGLNYVKHSKPKAVEIFQA